MGIIYVFLATGFEEIEALVPIDIFKRAGFDVKTVSIHGMRYVESTHGIMIKADLVLREVDFSNADMLVLPGGMPGAEELSQCNKLNNVLIEHDKRGGLIGAICAAPMVLGKLGLLKKHRATCYPGFESFLEGATYTAADVEVDRNITTAYGPGAAFDFGFTLLSQLTESSVVEQVKRGMMIKK